MPGPWFERTFEFSLADDAYPALIERLGATPARVEAAAAGLDDATLARRDGERWSIQEHAGHLVDLDAATFLPRCEEFQAGVVTLRAADLTNRLTHEARHNDRAWSEVLASLRAVRGSMVTLLRRMPATAFARRAIHPRLRQSMRLIDHLEFVAEHDDHHVASMLELRARWGAPPA